MPHKVDSVNFIKARVGDKTIINHNYVHLYKDSVGCHTPLIDLHVGYKVEVLEIKGKWNKVKYEKWGYDADDKYVPFDYVGYIETKYLSPVEICIQKGIER